MLDQLNEARLSRSVTLHFMGDPGRANLHRILGWICAEFGRRSGAYTRVAIWNGLGFVDNVQAVGRGQVDLALATPASFVSLALAGRGPHAEEPFEQLRALATMPQDDRLVLAVDAALGVRSFGDIHAGKVPLRIATAQDDGINYAGLAAHALLSAEGLTTDVLESWGGGFAPGTWYNEAIASFRNGEANAILHEAIMTKPWQALAEERDLTFIPVGKATRELLFREYAWPGGSLPAGYLRGMDEPLDTMDFSDFLVFVRNDMPDDVAFVLTRLMVETRASIEAQYLHVPPERSPLTYPLIPAKMANTTIPLHRGAERYYTSQGLL